MRLVAFVTTFGLVGAFFGSLFPEKTALAQGEPSQTALVAARELFREATQDADAQHYDLALDKFKRVASTKETAPVRFNIAKCEQALGRLGAALADYELAEREAAQEKKADIAKLAQKGANALRPRVPRLTLTASTPPKDLAVTLDGEKLPSGSLGIALPVDPGAHKIEATAPGHTAFKRELVLKEAEHQRVALELATDTSAAAVAVEDVPEVKLALEQAPPPPSPKDPPPAADEPVTTGRGRKTWGFILLGTGAVLSVTALVFWRMHESKVSDIETICARGCPRDRASELRDMQSASKTDQALAAVFAIGGGLALASGAVLLLLPNKKPALTTTRLTPALGPGVAGVSLSGGF